MRWNEIYDELKSELQLNSSLENAGTSEPEPDDVQSRYMQMAFNGGPVDLSN